MISLSCFNKGNIFFILDISTELLSDFPLESDDAYDKNNFSSAVENALYILKLSSYILSSVPLASSTPYVFMFSLSSSFKNPSDLFTVGKFPSFKPIINTALTLCVLDLSTSPITTWSCAIGIVPNELFTKPIFNIFI